ncbi:hypothetical protein AB0M43_38340 [Longispora sp. NPDC051575]|uniref:hypothetical protein n=1 Tax=Longispora sp. NPDC051575 TaxID=3154943 RepID=UPI00342B435C
MSAGRRLAQALHARLPDWTYRPAEGPDGVEVLDDGTQDWTLTVDPAGRVELARRGQPIGHLDQVAAAELVALVTCSAGRAGYVAPAYRAPVIRTLPGGLSIGGRAAA